MGSFFFLPMKYFYTKKSYTYQLGKMVLIKHPIYRRCTLYRKKGKDILVVQKRFNPITRHCWWDAVDPDLATDIFSNEKFEKFFERNAKSSEDPDPPIFEVRKLMWALRMKPIKRESWESYF